MLSLVIIVLLFSSKIFCTDDNFNEELFIRQLPSGHVYSFFQFTTTWNVNIFDEPLRKKFYTHMLISK